MTTLVEHSFLTIAKARFRYVYSKAWLKDVKKVSWRAIANPLFEEYQLRKASSGEKNFEKICQKLTELEVSKFRTHFSAASAGPVDLLNQNGNRYLVQH